MVCWVLRKPSVHAPSRASFLFRHQIQRIKQARGRACLGRWPSDSNSSISYFHFSVFSVIWGICFSLEANPNDTKNIGFWHTFGTGDSPATGGPMFFENGLNLGLLSIPIYRTHVHVSEVSDGR